LKVFQIKSLFFGNLDAGKENFKEKG
jgi:hypothetical protein